MSEPITPHRLREMKKRVREARSTYYAARKAALGLPKSTPRERLAREDALANAWAERYWYYRALARLAAGEARGVVKGANVSSDAKARAIASGRWKPDSH